MKIRNLVAALLAVPAFASAGNISVSDTQAFTGSGQFFNFNFNSLGAISGTDGKLTITLNGDYSTNTDLEWAKFALEDSGNLVLGGYSNWVNGISSNGVSGLSLSSYSLVPIVDLNDNSRTWVFNLSNSLLNTLVADNKFKVKVTNGAEVDTYHGVDPDFIRIGLSFNGAEVANPASDVPEPTSLALVGLGLAALATRRRKQA
jgi:hypothetical protein